MSQEHQEQDQRSHLLCERSTRWEQYASFHTRVYWTRAEFTLEGTARYLRYFGKVQPPGQKCDRHSNPLIKVFYSMIQAVLITYHFWGQLGGLGKTGEKWNFTKLLVRGEEKIYI